MALDNCKLPYDVLRHVVDAYATAVIVKPRGRWQGCPSREPLWALSLTCKDVKRLCDFYIHEEYTLTLRMHATRHTLPIAFTKREEAIGFRSWDVESVTERVRRFADRASFVKVLRLVDCGDEDIRPLPDMIVPDLVAALGNATRLQDVILKIGGTHGVLATALWDALSKREIKRLKIQGLAPPAVEANVKPMLSVKDLTLQWVEGHEGYLELFDPTKIHVKYINLYSANDQLPPMFAPKSTNLRHIRATYALSGREVSYPILDLSATPQATIEVIFRMTCDLKIHQPALWRSMKDSMRVAFAEGLSGYDVTRLCGDYGSDGCIARPALVGEGTYPEWVPTHQVHLEGEDEDRREERRMHRYYQKKILAEFFAMHL